MVPALTSTLPMNPGVKEGLHPPSLQGSTDPWGLAAGPVTGSQVPGRSDSRRRSAVLSEGVQRTSCKGDRGAQGRAHKRTLHQKPLQRYKHPPGAAQFRSNFPEQHLHGTCALEPRPTCTADITHQSCIPSSTPTGPPPQPALSVTVASDTRGSLGRSDMPWTEAGREQCSNVLQLPTCCVA